MGKLEIPGGKSNLSRLSVWEASENRQCNFSRQLFLSLFSCSGYTVFNFHSASFSRFFVYAQDFPRCATNADCRLADWQVNEVNIVVKYSNRFPISKLDFVEDLKV